MPDSLVPPAGLALAGALAVIGWLLVRSSGAPVALARRFAGAGSLRVGDLLDLDEQPPRPVRVAGRVRCPDPILTDRDERLVALHRDVEVQLPDGRWRTIERLRESRGFELWDHDGSLPLDPARAAEPLIAIPHVWRGRPDELTDPAHHAAVERLAAEGVTPRAARSVTRTISVVDRLLVLATVQRSDAAIELVPPEGGFVISALELSDAMRLLGGARRGRLLAGSALIVAGIVLALASGVALLLR